MVNPTRKSVDGWIMPGEVGPAQCHPTRSIPEAVRICRNHGEIAVRVELVSLGSQKPTKRVSYSRGIS